MTLLDEVRTMVFDLDGTLVDSAGDITASASHALVEHGYSERTVAQVRPYIGRPAAEIFTAAGVPDSEVGDLVSVFRAHLADTCGPGTVPFPGVVDLLASLGRAGIPVGVATTKPTRLASVVLERVGLLPLIAHVQGTDGFEPKPAPDVILRCLEVLTGLPAAMVGDTPDDVHAGRRAGVITVAVLHGTRADDELRRADPDLTLPSIVDLGRVMGLWR